MAHTALTKSEKATLAARRTGCYIALVLISFLCLFFFYVLVINSTRTHFEIQKGFSLLPGKSLMTNLTNVLNDANIPVLTGVRNSLIVSACSAALSVYFSALTAYGIYAYNFRFKKAAFAIILLIMTMPTQVSALGFLQLITKMGLKNSFLPLIIPSIAAPAVFFFMKQYLDASLPMEIVEAARIDGAGEFYTFNKIVLPIMKPALAVQAIFAFVSSWNNYFIPALVLDTADKKTLPILIAQLRSADFLKFDMGKVYMMVAVAILPVIVVYLLLAKCSVRGVALGGVKGENFDRCQRQKQGEIFGAAVCKTRGTLKGRSGCRAPQEGAASASRTKDQTSIRHIAWQTIRATRAPSPCDRQCSAAVRKRITTVPDSPSIL